MPRRYKLSPWCKKARVTLIMKDMTAEDVAEKTGYCVQHVNSILSGRLKSQKAVDKISDVLGISNVYD